MFQGASKNDVVAAQHPAHVVAVIVGVAGNMESRGAREREKPGHVEAIDTRDRRLVSEVHSEVPHTWTSRRRTSAHHHSRKTDAKIVEQVGAEDVSFVDERALRSGRSEAAHRQQIPGLIDAALEIPVEKFADRELVFFPERMVHAAGVLVEAL